MLCHLPRVRHVVSHYPLWHISHQRRPLLTLAIETSCDDTCVAILEKYNGENPTQGNGSISLTQAKLHFHEKITANNTGHGGIHPLEALDSHREHLAKLIAKSVDALPVAHEQATPSKILYGHDGNSRKKPDFVSVTRGPGMRSNLSCGLDTAKGLATAWSVPMVGVHHMQAHALTPRLVHALESSPEVEASPAFPFLNLLVSGGHTMLLRSDSLTSHSILANTVDIAIGDCLDKCGRSILPQSILSTTTDTSYGKHLSSYAFPDQSLYPIYYPIPSTRGSELDKPPNEYNWSFQLPLARTRDLAFSYAGISSHLDRLIASRGGGTQLSDDERLALARAVLGTAFEHLVSRICLALQSLSSKSSASSPSPLVVSGGVAANSYLRYFLRATLDARGFEHIKLVFPPVDLCTDNAAMIAWAGMEMYEAGWRTDLGVGAVRKWSLSDDVAESADEDANASGVGKGEAQKREHEGMWRGGVLGIPGWIRV